MYTVGASASETVDNVFWFIVIISVVLLLIITALMIFFAVRYNRKRHPESKELKQSLWLEITWTLIPTALVLAMFFYGLEGFRLMRDAPKDAMQVKVYGRMWDWSFEYENGKRTDKLFVPIGKNVQLVMRSLDVIHSFYIPAFRIKEDLLPGRDTYLWFKPQTVGPTDIFCAEYCGQRHAYMMSQVVVMPEPEFDAWYSQDKGEPGMLSIPAVKIMDDHGCLGCHSLDGSNGDMIPLNGIMGQKRMVVRGEQEFEIEVDEDYIRRSIKQPGFELMKGQLDIMEVPEDLTDEELELIVKYLVEWR